MKPNIIFFFADQQRSDTFTEETMPNLTKLASEGVVFDNAFTCQPVCGPARACLQTGVYASENGSYINAIPLTNERKPLAKYMSEAGYETAYVGKWHLASGMGPGAPHYEKSAVPLELRGGYNGYWMASDVLEFTSDGYHGYVFDKDNNKVEFEGVRSDAITDYALDFIDKQDGDKPFFLFLSHIEPHHQNSTDDFECAKEDEHKFDGAAIPDDLKDIAGGNYRAKYPKYLSCINRLDYNLGRIVELLKHKGIYDSSIIIYTSDHGCHFKTRNVEYKRSCHEGSIHIPFVITGGAFNGGRHEEKLVSLIDVPATILSLAGVGIPSDYRGKDIANLLGDKVNHNEVYIEISESQTGRCIRTPRYTYSVKTRIFNFFRKSAKVYVEDYLYDNEKDHGQMHNLIKDPSYNGIKDELRERLLTNIEAVEGFRPKIRRRILRKRNI